MRTIRQDAIRKGKRMAKGQLRSNREKRKPKAKAPKKITASNASKRTLGMRADAN